MTNESIYIAGSDGSGKTTVLRDIETYYKANNIQTKHIWLRSPKILSKPLMAYCRLVGLTKYSTINGVKYCKREQFKSPFVSWIFPILQLLDFKIKWFFDKRKINSNEILLFDRFNIDTLVDLMADTRRFDLHKTWIGKEFLKLTPEKCKLIILKVDEDIIRKRKIDTLHDVSLKDKINSFQILSSDLGITLIENNEDYNKLKKNVFKILLNDGFKKRHFT